MMLRPKKNRFLPKNWEDLFFQVEISLFIIFIIQERMRRGKNDSKLKGKVAALPALTRASNGLPSDP